ncbi:MAG: diaminopimelate decarboxylase [Oscillospiraceae bacterium]|nr:diaminopimelate decarboxylase [Oscillospiraceae bacterium]
MFVSDSLAVNGQGHLTFSGVDTVSLAEKYGTPLYVMSEDGIRKNCRAFKNAVDKYYGGNGLILYASKAFCCKEMYRIIKSEGLGIDVVSGGELYTALSVGFPAEKIYFHGNNKTPDEIKYAVENKIACFVVDHIDELEIINSAALKEGITQNVMLRIKPGIDAHTHEFIKTGQIDSKFGFLLDNGEAMNAVKAALAFKNLNLCGLHCHIGSQIFEEQPFEFAARIMLKFLAQIKSETGVTLSNLNLGGGFGIKYVESDMAIPFENYIQKVSEVVKAECKNPDIAVPFILMEPGRAIVGSEGLTLYTVGFIKDIPNVRKFVSIDGGMSDNPRYALYQAEYSAAVANKVGEDACDVATIAGKCCESGDLIQKDCKIQKAKTGDILAVFSTGAYNYSMSSNYNRLPKPPVVMIRDGDSREVVKGEKYEDVLKNDL